jgi:lipopolysaccharide export system protein LptA
MISNFRAAMPRHLIPLAFALAATFAHAEKGDRLKPLTLSSERGGSVDNVNQVRELVGNVVITQGSLLLHAERVVVKETREGYVQAHASGVAGQPVNFRQNRDTPGEAIEGQAEQIEYDTRTETVRFIGNARVRTTRGAVVQEEMSGAAIVYNSRTEVITFEGGNGSPNPNGRTRIVRMPPPLPDDSASSPTAPLPLKPSITLQPGKPS